MSAPKALATKLQDEAVPTNATALITATYKAAIEGTPGAYDMTIPMVINMLNKIGLDETVLPENNLPDHLPNGWLGAAYGVALANAEQAG